MCPIYCVQPPKRGNGNDEVCDESHVGYKYRNQAQQMCNLASWEEKGLLSARLRYYTRLAL